jgi:hypothetical protein
VPIGDFINRLAAAFMARERQRLGIPQEERAAQEAATTDLIRRAQARRLMQQTEMAPAEQESQIGLRSAQADAARALAGQRETPKAGTPHYERDAAGNVTAVIPQLDGSFRKEPIGPIGTPQQEPREPRRRLPVRITEYDPVKRKNVIRIYDPNTFEQIAEKEAPLPATEQKQVGIVGSVADQVKTMERLATSTGFEGVTAPIMGGASKLKAEITREGEPADFDYAAKLAKDLVYFKTGAQLNETEQRQLDNVVPNRARGNLPMQVARFKRYVGFLFAKYGIQDDLNVTGDGAPGGVSPNVQRILNMLQERNASPR